MKIRDYGTTIRSSRFLGYQHMKLRDFVEILVNRRGRISFLTLCRHGVPVQSIELEISNTHVIVYAYRDSWRAVAVINFSSIEEILTELVYENK